MLKFYPGWLEVLVGAWESVFSEGPAFRPPLVDALVEDDEVDVELLVDEGEKQSCKFLGVLDFWASHRLSNVHLGLVSSNNFYDNCSGKARSFWSGKYLLKRSSYWSIEKNGCRNWDQDEDVHGDATHGGGGRRSVVEVCKVSVLRHHLGATLHLHVEVQFNVAGESVISKWVKLKKFKNQWDYNTQRSLCSYCLYFAKTP